jgi:hypothetical protein
MSKVHNKKDLIAILEKKKSKERFMNFPTTNGRIDKRSCKILDYVIHQQSDAPQKYFVLDVIKASWKKEVELRIGYYILGKKPKVLNKWVWGQYCPLIPKRDLKALMNKAKRRGLL